MDDRSLLALARALQAWIRPHLTESEPLRRLAAELGQWLLDESRAAVGDAESRDAASAAAAESDADAMAGAVLPDTPDRFEPPADAGLVADIPHAASDAPRPAPPRAPAPHVDKAPWTIGDLVSSSASAGTGAAPRNLAADDLHPDAHPTRDQTPEGLALVERRCRLKADACRVLIDRRAAADDPLTLAPVVDRIQSMLHEARSLPDCFLWVFYRARTQPDDDVLRTIAECYDALAAATSLRARAAVARVAKPDEVQLARLYLAESSSALRVALDRTWLTLPDTDQLAAHAWLREEAADPAVWVPRYMRLNDPASPGRAPALMAEIESLRRRLDARLAAAADERAAFRQIRYHVHRLPPDPDSSDYDARKITETIGSLLAAGVSPADARFGEVISTAAASRLSTVTSGPAAQVLDRILDAPLPTPQVDDTTKWSERVAEVRDRLKGRQVVIVGGEPRVEAISRIEDAFNLPVVWVRLTEHGGSNPMRAPIAHADTALVLGLVKLAGHDHLSDASAWSRAAGKPFVLLPAGYNPEQIAAAVLEQASRDLERLQTG